MTLTATQPTTGRPPIELVTTGLPVVGSEAEGAVTGIIQRSTDGVVWRTVRGGIDMEIDGSGNLADVDDCEFAPEVQNDYRAGTVQEIVDTFGRTESGDWGGVSDTAHVWSDYLPPNGLVLTGVAGLYASTPDHASLDIVGDIEVAIEVSLDDWTPAAAAVLIAKSVSTGNQRSWLLLLETSGLLRFQWSTTGADSVITNSTAVPVPDAAGRLAIKVTLVVASGTVTFFTGDSISTATTQLGAAVVAGATSIFSSTAVLEVGSNSAGASNNAVAVIHSAEVRSGVAGTVVANPDFRAQAFGTTSFADSTGKTWTVQGAAVIEPGGNAYDIAAGVGTVLHAVAGSLRFAAIGTPDDIGDARASVSLSTNAASGITGEEILMGLAGRYVDVGNHYQALVTIEADDTVSMLAGVWFDGAFTMLDTVATGLVYTGAETYRVEAEWKGATFKARVWDPDVTPRPEWMISEPIPFALRITGGQVGVMTYRNGSNTNVNFTINVNDFVVDTGTPTYLAALTDSITPTLNGFWLTSTLRSFLNCAPMVVAFEEPERADRGGGTYVAGRTLPIAQAELAGAREWTLTLRVPTLTAARQLEYVIASGDVFYLLCPLDCPIPSGYYRVGQMGSRRVIPRGAARLFTLPLEECAAPGPDVATASATWATVVALYGTWADVVAANATWDDLLDLIGDPSEVIVE